MSDLCRRGQDPPKALSLDDVATLLAIVSDPELGRRLCAFYEAKSSVVLLAATAEEAINRARSHAVDVVLADMDLQKTSTVSLVAAIRDSNPDAVVIVAASVEGLDEAVRAVKSGAYAIIRCPVNLPELDAVVDRALEHRRLTQEAQSLRGERNIYYRTEYFVGQSPAIRRTFDIVKKVALTDASVILRGESGTGKELLAGAIHYSSARKGNAIVRVNCAALPDQLLESELFGHERGAFTGADRVRIGRFEQANGGSVFLDEVGDMRVVTQPKVLRVIQEREFERLGSNRTIRTNVRLISATHRDLEGMVAQGTFREDLYFRLNVVTITVPPLRERDDDVVLLAEFFLKKMAHDLKRDIPRLAPEAVARMRSHSWPGNVRELQNAIERALILSDGKVIGPAELGIVETRRAAPSSTILPAEGVKLSEVERRLVIEALERCEWVQSRAAELLGISRRVMNYKVQRLGLTHPRWSRAGEEQAGSQGN
jgi:DNA-binding NtrC family response regulator